MSVARKEDHPLRPGINNKFFHPVDLLREIPPGFKTVFIGKELNTADHQIEISIGIAKFIFQPLPLRLPKQLTISISIVHKSFDTAAIRGKRTPEIPGI